MITEESLQVNDAQFYIDAFLKDFLEDYGMEQEVEADPHPLLKEHSTLLWWLSYLANAYTRARRLEALRSSFYEELYESVRYHSNHYHNVYRPGEANPSTDVQAIKIIESKERYEGKIRKEYRLHTTWKRILLDWASEKERILMIRHFQKGKPVDAKIIAPLIDRMQIDLVRLERQIEQERNEESTAEYRALQAIYRPY